MIVITGAAGFIGSCLVSFFNKKGYSNIIAVDDFSKKNKDQNLKNKLIVERVDRNKLEVWLKTNAVNVDFIIHVGARTDTAEFDSLLLKKLNYDYSIMIWNISVKYKIPIIYASSAATYGLGEYGFLDDHKIVNSLKPLNPYGVSKNNFDKWALKQNSKPKFWAGLKFFNVYGPNEYHKGRMSSVIFHFFNQIMQNKEVNLFRSHNPLYKDGEQKRDFIYVKDLLKMIFFLFSNYENIESGIYNIGSSRARTFNDLAKSIFKVLNIPVKINYVDTPHDIRDKYQYYTEAKMDKLINSGYKTQTTKLEEGVSDYINSYLKNSNYY